MISYHQWHSPSTCALSDPPRGSWAHTEQVSHSLVGFIRVIQLNEHSISVILICRFHLDLQRTHAHPNSSDSRSVPSISLGSFRATVQSLHDAVVAEFGDPIPSRDRPGSEWPNDDVVIPDIPEATSNEEIELTKLRFQPQRSWDAVEV